MFCSWHTGKHRCGALWGLGWMWGARGCWGAVGGMLARLLRGGGRLGRQLGGSTDMWKHFVLHFIFTKEFLDSLYTIKINTR